MPRATLVPDDDGSQATLGCLGHMRAGSSSRARAYHDGQGLRGLRSSTYSTAERDGLRGVGELRRRTYVAVGHGASDRQCMTCGADEVATGPNSDRCLKACEHGGQAAPVEPKSSRCECPGGTWGALCEVATVEVSAGGSHTCAVRTDGVVVCWGENFYGQATPVPGEYRSVSAGAGFTCAVRTDGGVACWGNDTYGEATPPSGTFRSVSAGQSHTCGVRTDGGVSCWGSDTDGQASPPAGIFDAVSAGSGHTCGLLAAGGVTCWGDNSAGQADPPGG